VTNSNDRQNGGNHQNLNIDVLDRELDAALAKFTRAEPRAGLEQRVFANLRTERQRATNRSWWPWPAVAALAAVMIVSLFLASRLAKPAQNIVEQHSQAPTRTNENVGTLANNRGSGSIPTREASGRPKPHAVNHTTATVVSASKLDKFPSPQPLNEQEKILARYVANYPEHAALIAQARAEELRQDAAEEMSEAASTGNENLQQRNR